jgi:thiosulfate dehydrogenase [quinone] large subunit
MLPDWAILPLRLFLAFSFLAAGLDKLGDPTFLDPAARDYLGNQITRFAPGTPLEPFLQNFALPNATLFGIMTLGGELCIGLALLLGLLTRFSAAMGMFLNLTFFLSATWDIHPFYFGPDLPYAICGLTLLLAGPGPLALDSALARWFSAAPTSAEVTGHSVAMPARGQVMTRRAFVGLGGAVLTGAAIAATGIGWGVLHPRKAEVLTVAGDNVVPTQSPPTAVAPTATIEAVAQPVAIDSPTPAATATPLPESTAPPTVEAASRQMVAAAGTLREGNALEFTLPDGQPAVLVHNASGYSAYVAICTHQGCEVRPAASGLLKCPCHGAVFDSNSDGQPIAGPARKPLSNVPLTVDASGNVYLA